VIAFALAVVLASVDPTPDPTPPPADCSLVNETQAALILGFPVETPDEASKTGGICFYVSQNVSEDGTLTYAIVTADRLPARRAFYRASARRCAPAIVGTLNELACRQFIALAQANDMTAYYAARSGAPDATPVSGLGDEAVETGNALYVHRGDEVFEVSVLLRGDLDVERTKRLASELLARTK